MLYRSSASFLQRRMRVVFLPALVATSCFAVGFLGVRWIGEKQGRSADVTESRKALEGLRGNNSGEESTAPDSVAAAKDFAKALVEFGKPSGRIADDHALATALFRLKPGDFPAGSSEILALFELPQLPTDSSSEEMAEAWL